MIAPQRVAPPPRHVERVRTATKRRVRRSRRRIHRPLFAVVALAIGILLPLLAYVTLTANLTSLTYAISRAERERTALVEESQRLDDRIARLKSPERLAAVAAQLKMHDPHVYAVVTLRAPQQPQPRPSGLALLGTWFTGKL